VHQLGGHQRALLAGVDADGLAIFEEEERGQGAARLGAAGRDELGRFEDVDGREIAIFGGAEIDADFHWIMRDWADLCMGGGVAMFLSEQSQFPVKLLI
jgi:hypothetical protein